MTIPIQPMTLCFIRERNSILLGKKKSNWGKGKWNGYGGKVGDIVKDETIEEALVREMKEESGVDILGYEKRGEIAFHYVDQINIVHIYEIIKYSGEAVETEEMRPQWFGIDNLPWDEMWEDDKLWMPYFFRKVYFTAKGTFDEKYNLLSFDIKEV
jgi:8-oxo-dGTP diphosphatase/2-hydroxy-dATP diphosphatase